MQRVTLESVRSVLCVGSHSDDIEIGCGGSILRLAREIPEIRFHWVVFSARGQREEEARRSAAAFLKGSASAEVVIHSFRDGYFPYQGSEIKDTFERLKSEVAPDLIFTHQGDDLHQDHRLLSELTWNTFRDHFILEYEIPKYDGGLGSPSLFLSLSEEDSERKIDYLLRYFPTQAGKTWFDKDSFRGIMRLRGMECNAPERFAEAFYVRKVSV